MAPTYKVAVIQLHPKPLQPEGNFEKASSFIRSAALQGADLAVLPEYHLTNWLPNDPKFLPLCDEWETYVKKYQALAKECNISIVPGTIVERHIVEKSEEDPEDKGHKLLNVAYFIDNTGEIVGKYIKKNLWGPERNHLTSSGRDTHEVFDTPIGRVGMLICWDLAFPEAFRELIYQGAKLSARLINKAVIFANAGGPPGKGYAGLSQVTVPYIGPLARLGSCLEGMATVDLDLGILEHAEENYQVRADLARDDWHYDYRHGNMKEKL
ncbi:carbon-nitrogen hydrolase protein [Rutstroemia sp. NJR-2017a BBW]|nr:carbon-nitrogen hydrolase protein [Rutstroemia sp. NJR-2017a BBW]